MSDLPTRSDLCWPNSQSTKVIMETQPQSHQVDDQNQINILHRTHSLSDMNDEHFDDEETDFMMTAFLSDADDVVFIKENGNEIVSECTDLKLFNRIEIPMDNRDYYRKYEFDDEYELPEPRAPSTMTSERLSNEMVNSASSFCRRSRFLRNGTFYSEEELDDEYELPEPRAPSYEIGYEQKHQIDSVTITSSPPLSFRASCIHEHDGTCSAKATNNIDRLLAHNENASVESTSGETDFFSNEVYYSEEELDDEYELPEPRAPTSIPECPPTKKLSNMYGTDTVSTRSSSQHLNYSSRKKRVIQDSERSPDVPPKKKMKKKMSIGMPKRPVSAYNVFFQEERNRLFQNRVSSTGITSVENPRVGFQELGKIIGQKWKMLSAAERRKYEEVSQIDIDRYRAEVDECQLQRRKRIEALCDLKTPEVVSTTATVSPVLSSAVRTNNPIVPPLSANVQDSSKLRSHSQAPCDSNVIDLTSEDCFSSSRPSAFDRSSTFAYSSQPVQVTSCQKVVHVTVPSNVPFVLPRDNSLRMVSNPKTGWRRAPLVYGPSDPSMCQSYLSYPSSSPYYQYQYHSPGAYYENGTYEAGVSHHYQGISCRSYTDPESFGMQYTNKTPAFVMTPTTGPNVGRSTNVCDSSVISSSSSPSLPPVISCADEDDGSACSNSTIISDGLEEKTTKTDGLDVLFAPTSTGFVDLASRLLPTNAMEVASGGVQNSFTGCYSTGKEADSSQKVYCSTSGRWYNIEYKCYRMKSSEANAYLSKLHDRRMEQ